MALLVVIRWIASPWLGIPGNVGPEFGIFRERAIYLPTTVNTANSR